MLRRQIAASALVGLSTAWGAANAQQPEERAREAVEQTIQQGEQREARESRAGGFSIPFGQILSAPEDVKLNLAYARQQIYAGDLKEAGATLERILLVDPTRHEVRVLYGLVLYRLGLYDKARFELELALESSRLSPALRAEAETYLNRIKYEQRRTRGALTLTTGVDWNSNRNQASSSGQVLFSDIPLPGQGETADAAYVFSVQGRLVHDLGFQEGHTLHAEATYYRSDKDQVDNLDLDAVSVAVGGTWYAGDWAITPRVRGQFYWLGDEDLFPVPAVAGVGGRDYLATLGGELEIAYYWNPRFKTYATIRGDHEDFRDLPNFQTASERTGRRLSTRMGADWRITSAQTLSVEAVYIDKNAARSYEAYERYGANIQHSWLLGRGAFSQLGFWAENSGYDREDAFVSPTIIRDEWLYRARATVGAPVSFFLPGAPEAIKDINLVAQYEYETVDSNILNYDYKAHKAAFLVSKRIAF